LLASLETYWQNMNTANISSQVSEGTKACEINSRYQEVKAQRADSSRPAGKAETLRPIQPWKGRFWNG